MKEDISLLARIHHGLCQAIERDGVVCFGKITAKSLCTKHYQRHSKYSSFDLPVKKIKKCKFIDCDENAKAKEYCKKHYAKHVRIPRNKLLKCIADGCETKRVGMHSYCGKHVKRLRVYGNLEGSGKGPFRFTSIHGLNAPRRKRLYEKCIVPNCSKTFHDGSLIKGLCSKHYKRWKKYGDYNVVSSKGRIKKQGSSHAINQECQARQQGI